MSHQEFEADFMKRDPEPRETVSGQQSPAARQVSEWFRQLGRLVRIARTCGPYAPLARQARERLVRDMLPLLEYHSPLVLRFSPLEIWLQDELLVRAQADDDGGLSQEHQLPFILHRNGLRRMTLAAETTREEIVAIVSAVIEITTSKLTHEDLCTLLWKANLAHVHVESEPLGLNANPCPDALRAAVSEQPSITGLTGIQRDDWLLPECETSTAELWRRIQVQEFPAKADFLQEWHAEAAAPLAQGVADIVQKAVHAESSAEMRKVLADAVVTWFAGAIQRCEWVEARDAFDILHTLDPEHLHSYAALHDALAGLDLDAIASQLDEASSEDQARFFALVVNAGPGALDFTVGVLGRAGRARLRAAATTALSYLCSDDPQMLAPYLADSRWHVVRNITFVLGQIGGTAVTGLLARAARHLDARVRRAAVIALAQVPTRERIPLLLEHLDTHDPQLLTNTLTMLTREKDTRVALSLLARINANDFETRSEVHRLALISALEDVADEGAVPALALLLQKGGWFARHTTERTAAARLLARIGTPAALQSLEEGSHSRAEAVRTACLAALHPKVGP